jgi:hypothetical protein
MPPVCEPRGTRVGASRGRWVPSHATGKRLATVRRFTRSSKPSLISQIRAPLSVDSSGQTWGVGARVARGYRRCCARRWTYRRRCYACQTALPRSTNRQPLRESGLYIIPRRDPTEAQSSRSAGIAPLICIVSDEQRRDCFSTAHAGRHACHNTVEAVTLYCANVRGNTRARKGAGARGRNGNQFESSRDGANDAGVVSVVLIGQVTSRAEQELANDGGIAKRVLLYDGVVLIAMHILLFA